MNLFQTIMTRFNTLSSVLQFYVTSFPLFYVRKATRPESKKAVCLMRKANGTRCSVYRPTMVTWRAGNARDAQNETLV